jgi:hypothetical protein
MSWRDTSNGLSSTSQSSTSSTAFSRVGPKSWNSLTMAGTSSEPIPAMIRRKPNRVTNATRPRRIPRRRRAAATGSSARPSSTAMAAVSTSTQSALSRFSSAQPTMPMPISFHA